MSTRSTTNIYEIWKDDKEKTHKDLLLALYKQSDGYIEGWGNDLKEFIKSGIFVNGINALKKGDKKYMFNGAGDFALQLVTAFKDGVGGLYATSKDDSQAYNYIIEYEHNIEPNIKTKVVNRLDGNKGNMFARLTISCKEEPSFKEEMEFEVK